jgi:hypothetical protein
MIELLPDAPDGVLGVRLVDDVTAEDYRTVLVPAVEQQLAAHGKVRAVAVVDGAFEGYSLGGVWQDARLGVAHPRSWERIAVVTDVEWLRHLVRAFGWAVPGDVELFGASQVADAVAWAAR